MSITHSPVQCKTEAIMPWSTLTWTYDADITTTDFESVHWDSGTLSFSNGESFTINGSTETFTGTKYVYWSSGDTVNFSLSTAVNVIGTGKVPIAVVIENADTTQEASLRVFQGPGLNITADNIATNTLSAISADMGYLTAGTVSGIEIYGSTITGGTLQTATGGQRIVIDGVSNTLKFYDTSNNEIISLQANAYSSYPGLKISNNGAINVYYDANNYIYMRQGQLYGVRDDAGGAGVQGQNLFDSSNDSLSIYGWTVDQSNNTHNVERIGIKGFSEIDDGFGTNTSNDSDAIGVDGIGWSAGVGNHIGLRGQSNDIALRLKRYSGAGIVDFSVDTDGYLNIAPTGDKILFYHNAGYTYTSLHTDVNGLFNIKPGGNRIRLVEGGAGSAGSDLYTDSSGYLHIIPDGDRITIWESGKDAGDSTQLWVDIDGYFHLKPDGDRLRLKESGNSVYTDIYTDANGYLNITPSADRLYLRYNTEAPGLSTGLWTDSSGNANLKPGTGNNLRLRDTTGAADDYTDLNVNASGIMTITPNGGETNIVGNLDVSGSYKMDNADIIDTSGNQTGIFKTRTYVLFGYNGTLNTSGTYYLVGAGGTDRGEYIIPYECTITAVGMSVNTALTLTDSLDKVVVNVQTATGYTSNTWNIINSGLQLNDAEDGYYYQMETNQNSPVAAGDRMRISLVLTEVDTINVVDPIVTVALLSK